MTGSIAERGDCERNRVPEVTVDFWLTKLLAVTVGETAADFLNISFGLGLPVTSVVMTGFLIAAMTLQFGKKRYVPWVYWLVVVLISVVGTLITDNLVDNLGISLRTSTAVFSVALVATFAAWYAVEKTLSIRAIRTARREAFYWLAILFTFALGTAAGDLVAEDLGLGYLSTGLAFGAIIGVVALAYCGGKMNAILAFWLAYILTRPMGASFGDLLSQPPADGGIGLGTIVTSFMFLACMVTLITYMTLWREDDEKVVAD